MSRFSARGVAYVSLVAVIAGTEETVAHFMIRPERDGSMSIDPSRAVLIDAVRNRAYALMSSQGIGQKTTPLERDRDQGFTLRFEPSSEPLERIHLHDCGSLDGPAASRWNWDDIALDDLALSADYGTTHRRPAPSTPRP